MRQQTSGSPERGWTEEASGTFLQIAAVAVPSRQEQIATLCGLIPAGAQDEFTVVELAAGGGTLATAVLEAFPRCHYVALDGSAVMREQLQQRLARFAGRVEVRDFELADTSWRAALPQPLRCVLCSLSIYHLEAAGKRRPFAHLAARLEPGRPPPIPGILAPAWPGASPLFPAKWDT